jgi:hypothetical protein
MAVASPLGTYEGLCREGRIGDPRTGCPRWPELLRLRWQRGELSGTTPGRCKSTNLCDYCAIQAAHENARMLSLDAIEDTRPMLLAIVGTRTATVDMAGFYNGRRRLLEALRDRFGRQVEYSALLEFTTGKGAHSGGQRRPHWNVFLKGLPVDQLDQVRELVRDVWCRYVDAAPEAQYVERLRDAGAAAQYVAKHFHKRDQQPPAGFRGQRFNCSRGYFGELSRAGARERARESLRLDRELWKARRDGLEGEQAQLAADQAIAEAAATSWAIEWVAPPRRPLEDRERHGLGRVPWFVVEAAWRWQDERDLINAGWAAARE